MTSGEIRLLKMHLEALEAHKAVMAGFVSVVLQSQMYQLPESQRLVLRMIYDGLFEKAIANLLSSNLGFSDASVQAAEHLKKSILNTLESKIK